MTVEIVDPKLLSFLLKKFYSKSHSFATQVCIVSHSFWIFIPTEVTMALSGKVRQSQMQQHNTKYIYRLRERERENENVCVHSGRYMHM